MTPAQDPDDRSAVSGSPRYASELWNEGFTTVPNLIFQAEISSGAKLLFTCLLFHGFRKGRAWPGQPRLARETGLSESTVKRTLRELEESGLVEIIRRGNKSNVYILHPDRLSSEAVIGQSDLSCEVTLTSEEEEGEEEEGKPPLPPQGGESQTSLLPGNPDGNGKAKPAKAKSKEVEEIWSHYLEVMEKPARPLPAEERRVILDALKVGTAAELRMCVSECHASDYHMKRGHYEDRDGQRYNKLTQIIKGRRGKETTRERLDFWLERAESAGSAVVTVPSADPAVIARRKLDVQRGHRLGDERAVQKAREAEAWLQEHGIETTKDESGWPTFRLAPQKAAR